MPRRIKPKKPIKIKRMGRPPKTRWYIVPNQVPKKIPRPCACGCGAMTKTGFFLRGHIRRLKEQWRRHIKCDEPLTGLALDMFEEYKLNPKRAITQIAWDYWLKNGETR